MASVRPIRMKPAAAGAHLRHRLQRAQPGLQRLQRQARQPTGGADHRRVRRPSSMPLAAIA